MVADGRDSGAAVTPPPADSTGLALDSSRAVSQTVGISPARVAAYVGIVFLVFATLGIALVAFTITTEYSADEVRDWAEVGAAGLAGVGAVVAASVAIFAILAQQKSAQFAIATQERAASLAVETQLRTSRDALEHQRLLATEGAKAERERSAGEALRTASAEFTATLANIDLYVSAVRDADENRRKDALGRLPNLQIEARARYETLRLLGSGETQRAGRMALRHAWAMWRQAVTGEDPRSDEYAEDPWTRYHGELRALLVSVRRDLGLQDPDDVFEEPTT